MTIPRNRPSGGYVGTTTIASAEFEHFDQYLSEAIHGEGGTYVLTQPLILGGNNLVIDLDFEVGGNGIFASDLSVAGNVSVSGGIACDGTMTIGTDLVVGDDLVVIGAMQANGEASFFAPVTAYDGAQFTGDVVFDDDIDVAGTATFAGTFDANGNWFLGGPATHGEMAGEIELRGIMTKQGAGKIVDRQQIIATDAHQTVLAAQVDSVYLPTGIITAPRNVEIIDTGATNGMRVAFRTDESTHSFFIKAPGGGLTLGSLIASTRPWGYCERINGNWVFYPGGA